MKYLKQGLRMLKAKGIHVMLDFHALPGVASANQMFAGRCNTDVQFYVSDEIVSKLLIIQYDLILSDREKLQPGVDLDCDYDSDHTHGSRL
jgi:uncharacterized protein involved in copper resistance